MELQPRILAVATMLKVRGLVWRVQVDTYEREVARYGGPAGIALAERLFHADSEAALKLLSYYDGDDGLAVRWVVTAHGIHFLLDDLDLDIAARHAMMNTLRESLGKEFKVDGQLRQDLGARFRKEKGLLGSIATPGAAVDPILDEGLSVLAQRSLSMRPIIASLRELEQRGELTVPVSGLAQSYIHMWVNRMSRSAARAQELVLYDFLYRAYESRLARARQHKRV